MPSEVASEIATAIRRAGTPSRPRRAAGGCPLERGRRGRRRRQLRRRSGHVPLVERARRGAARCPALLGELLQPGSDAPIAPSTPTLATGMSVAVQSMVDARVAGVMFTLNPVSGDPSSIAIDASYGLGYDRGRRRGHSRFVPRLEGHARGRRAASSARRRSNASRPRAGTAPSSSSVDSDRRARLCLEPAEIASLVELARRGRSPLRPSPGSRVGDRPPTRRGLPASEPAGDGVEPETPHATGRRARRALGDRRHLPPRLTEGEAAVSEGSELSPEDVKEILRLIDESEFDELELETPRFSLRFSRRGAGAARRADTSRALGPRRGAGSRGGHRLPRAGPR